MAVRPFRPWRVLTLEQVRHFLTYDPDTGMFYWRNIPYKVKAKIGDIAGHKDRLYWRLCLSNARIQGHQLAFLYMTGSVPDEIDHINRDGHDNAWSNLRPFPHFQNLLNRGQMKNNTSGICGVFWSKRKKKWIAMINFDSKTYRVGQFDEKEKAASARESMLLKLQESTNEKTA